MLNGALQHHNQRERDAAPESSCVSAGPAAVTVRVQRAHLKECDAPVKQKTKASVIITSEINSINEFGIWKAVDKTFVSLGIKTISDCETFSS